MYQISENEAKLVSGGVTGSISVELTVDVNKLIETFWNICFTSDCYETKVNDLVNKWLSEGKNLQNPSDDRKSWQIEGSDWIVEDRDGDGKWDHIWDYLGDDMWRVFDGQEWKNSDYDPWKKARFEMEGFYTANTLGSG